MDAIESAIGNYEMAYRMQSVVPDVLNLDRESSATKRLYGLDTTDENKRGYSLQCLRARRLIESGVRFVETHLSSAVRAEQRNLGPAQLLEKR